MKNLFCLTIFASLLIFCSCSDDDCSADVLGTYVGTESCPGVVNNLTMVISTSSQEGQVVFSVSGTSLTFNGDLSSDCSSITVPNQNISLSGIPGNIDGTFNVNSTTLTGTLSFSTGEICSYNLLGQ